jgi:hypothetical protein
MTGANMHLVTVNVKLGENDPEPEQKLDPVGHEIYIGVVTAEANATGRAHHQACHTA